MMGSRTRLLRHAPWLLSVLALVFFLEPARGQAPQTTDWRHWGHDGGTSHYAPLDQINRDNFKTLEVAWRWKAENFGPRPDYDWKVTPLAINGVLYFTAGTKRAVVAADATTGETLWVYKLEEGSRGQTAPNRGRGGRGLAYWTDGKGDERLLFVSLGYQLIALNPKTGRPIPGFGHDGIVDLWEGFDGQPRAPREGDFSLTSPPAIVGDVVVVGAALGGSRDKMFVGGFPRGFDVRTGKRLWQFRTIPRPGEFGNDTWLTDPDEDQPSWAYTGHTGSWAPLSVDEELGYVYLPIESPTNDYYGGHRPGDNLFANSIVCLDAKTGKRIWHFQITHHDIWDYDLPAAPNLVDITVNGRRIKALAQVTKQGFTFVFDRVTGEPIWPIVERPVPQSDVPGEKSSPTQPFPTKPAPFERQGVTVNDLIDFTPELHAQAKAITEKFAMVPLYTPASLNRAALQLPNQNGGANWQGAAFDPETGFLYIGSATSPRVTTISKDPRRTDMDYIGGSRYNRETFIDGLPIIKPPWGRITAINLNTGEHVWVAPNGPTPAHIKNHPALRGIDIGRTGSADASGLLVTKTLFISGSSGLHPSIPPDQGAPLLLALDKATGALIDEIELPDGLRPTGAPMTYMANGQQYIVVAVGAAPPATRQTVPAELVALRLP